VAPPERPPPFAGQMESMNNNSLAPPRRDPLEFELREEKGSDMRLRAAAVFWRDRNRHLHKKNEKMPGGRAKRSLEDYGAQLEARRIEVGEQIARMDREDFPQKIVDSDFVINLPDYEQPQHRLQNSPQLDENAPRMEVLARNRTRATAKFGHHNLPKGEVKDSVRWPWQIWPYMHCMTMACVCPLFRGSFCARQVRGLNWANLGTVDGSQCILPNGKPLKRAIRKEFRQYTRAELELFLETMRRFKASGLYSRFGMIHRRLEIVFRAMHPENSEPILGLPYWDSTLDGDLPSPEDSIICLVRRTRRGL
uniref:PIPK domain-containing protein n=1 Tax=Globodera pallida TaxID=36090 RepID=A0A183CKF1_GLOPA